MSDATQTQTLEQTLNKTDLGHIIYENRKVFFAALLAVFVCVSGYVFWKQARSSAAMNVSVEVFHFQNDVWNPAREGKLSPEDLVKKFQGLSKDAQTAPVMLPLALEMGKFLFDKGSLNEANTILSQVAEVKHPVGSFFVGMQRAVILEKMDKTDEAIGVLEKLNSTKEGLMPAKVSLELGRLYLKKGEKAKAQSQFDNVVSTYPNDEQAKLAKLYLGSMNQ